MEVCTSRGLNGGSKRARVEHCSTSKDSLLAVPIAKDKIVFIKLVFRATQDPIANADTALLEALLQND